MKRKISYTFSATPELIEKIQQTIEKIRDEEGYHINYSQFICVAVEKFIAQKGK